MILCQKPSGRYSISVSESVPTRSTRGPSGKQSAKSARTRDAILIAAAAVIRTDGVTNLTLERVAATAGVSKGGLLYHFATKQDLVVAMLARTLEDADASLHDLASQNDRSAGSFAQAYLDYVRSGQHEGGAATGVFAAAALDEGDLEPAQAMFDKWQQRLLNDDGLDESTALLARVVGDGLWLIDLFGLAPPSADQRAALLSLVERQIDSNPRP